MWTPDAIEQYEAYLATLPADEAADARAGEYTAADHAEYLTVAAEMAAGLADAEAAAQRAAERAAAGELVPVTSDDYPF